MKIGFITTSRIPSKTANSIQVMKVCHAVQSLGMDIHLWVPDFGCSDWDSLAENYGLARPFQITWLPFQRWLKQYDFCLRAVNEARKWGAKVIYTWAIQAAAVAGFYGMPTIMEFHDFPMGRIGPHLFRIWMGQRGKKLLLSTTRALADGLMHDYRLRLPDEILQIAPNGTDPERYAHLPDPVEARKALALPEGFTVGYSGHFYPGRGMSLLTRIAAGMPHTRFLWMGGAEADIAPWKKALADKGIHNVTITGFIPNSRLPLYQAAADCLVMPYGKKISGSSGGDISRVINPMKMFDYLACGRAIIASDIPVFHEVLNDENAIFCDAEQAGGWMRAIQTLADDPARRAALASKAKRDAAQYTWQQRAKRTMDKLGNLIS
jgi:glycosyltransferase involved in cell wall biosynthesis